MNGGSVKQVAILVTIGVVAVSGIGGALIVPASGVLILGFAGTITAQLLVLLNQERSTVRQEATTKQVAQQVIATAAEVKQVKEISDKKLDNIAAVGVETKKLVNHRLGVELLSVMELTAWKAEREPSDANLNAAAVAKRAYENHVKNQALVDADAARESAV